MNLSSYLQPVILDLLLKNVAYTPASTIYVALFTALDDDGDTVTEVSGDNYSRTAVTYNAASAGSVSNQQVTFPEPSDAWGTITHVGLYDASSDGNLLLWGALTEARAVASGQAPRFTAGNLTVSLPQSGLATSEHIANALLNRILRNQSWTALTPYAALSTVDPGPSGASLTEPSGGSYARVDVSSSFAAAQADGEEHYSDNSTAVEWATASGDWGTITHVALMSASSGGNLILRAAMASPVSVLSGQTARFGVGEMVWRAA